MINFLIIRYIGDFLPPKDQNESDYTTPNTLVVNGMACTCLVGDGVVFLESDVEGSPKVAVDAMLPEEEEGSSLTDDAECFDGNSLLIDDDLDAEWCDLEDDPAAAPHAPPLSRLTSFLTSSMLPIDDDELLNRNKSDLVRHT